MAKGKTKPPEVKAAVMASLLAGQGVCEVAKEYKLPQRTVSNWKKQIPANKLAEVGSKKEEDFSDLLATYLKEILTTLAVQVRHFRTPEYLKENDAADLGTQHGILCDKAFRILEAAERANEGTRPSTEAV
jgi:transposase-like protein